ncbi:MAG: hypothetical protein QN141_08230 [Armatimonadota bacterium]|nr:hypothetical protein [Armatimonadota bacterium]MDR7451168.1 hypothetical protein [Armatimonadota bacterium]MDR7467227.1 hypothetical protein [Armatimonadota bacterium]MDR7494845.1 hypothetical protein [Armatimonadota bacterium]MDR7500262.1 hypothetical protein [Armatimonadota bacterium]
MDLRLLLSRLADARTRGAAGRALAVVAVLGFLLTMAVLLASGGGLHQWFFVLLVWALFVYVPLRILLEAAGTLGPAVRRRLAAAARGRADRYAARSQIELMVDGWLERHVVMPRIATPVQAAKARDGAVAVLALAGSDDAGLRRAVGRCLAVVDRWVATLGRRAAEEQQSIQDRWTEVRALAALAAMTRLLLAAYTDRTATPFDLGDGRRGDPEEFLQACLDYCDDLALEVDAPPWPEPPLGLHLPQAQSDEIRTAWTRFVETGLPALEARAGFASLLFTPSAP